ncbi:hypothetical protein ES705_45914 [subsurface metagenome]
MEDSVTHLTISTVLRAIVGDNAFILQATETKPTAQLIIGNSVACDWSCNDIQVKPVQDASDEGTMGLYVHSVDLNQLVLSKESILAKVYYDHDDPILLKTFNLHIFEPCENAVYIRFLTRDGYYMYWAFSPYPKTEKSGDKIGNVINNFSEMALANSRNLPIGYRNSFNKMALIASSVPIAFRRKLIELFTSPAVYLWQGQETLGENLITGIPSDFGYDTLMIDGIMILSAINAAGNAFAWSDIFSVTIGEIILVILDLNMNSGENPSVRLDVPGVMSVSNTVALAAGFNLVSLTCTASVTTAKLRIHNTAATNFSTSAIIVKRKEIELDWILLEKVEGSHELREKRKNDNFECTLVLPENYTQQLSGQNL